MNLFQKKKEIVEEKHTGKHHTHTGGHNHNKEEKYQELINERKGITEVIAKGHFSNIIFCKEENVFIFSEESGNNIYLKTEDTVKQILNMQGAGSNMAWSKDCSRIYYREKTKDYKIIVKSINVNTLEIKEYLEYNSGTDLSSIAISDTIYEIDQKTLGVYAKYNGKKWSITKEKGNYYKTLVSPNNKYIVAHKGAYVLLFNTSGKFIKNLGKGIATQWLQNSKELIGFLDESGNHGSVSNSDLYMFNIKSEIPKKITHTNEI